MRQRNRINESVVVKTWSTHMDKMDRDKYVLMHVNIACIKLCKVRVCDNFVI